ncbi:hypothetical protein [Paenarthrobacter nicotinovorans]|uniref:hypothetical protein n=1 Tax=Paenarthrobacter nicotinovorans TaxID=29320 RepID=UPI0011A3C326|nr:hypothetical protein [Paenarthrobacter nicotinovorans]
MLNGDGSFVATHLAATSFGVLVYYLAANIAAFTQSVDDYRYPKALQMSGAIGCVVPLSTLLLFPWSRVF